MKRFLELKIPKKVFIPAQAGIENLGIISDLVAKKVCSLSEILSFSAGYAKGESQVWPRDPLPGQKSIRLVKKGGGSSFLNAGFRRFSPAIPLPPRLFAETRKRELRRFLPALFGFGACFLARATRKRV
jgi:hypothetical protein